MEKEKLFKNNYEKEIVGLYTIYEMLLGVVNNDILNVGDGACPEVHFQSSAHQKLFNILFVDFLSKPDEKYFNLGGSYLDFLEMICANPLVGKAEDIRKLEASTQNLLVWLGDEVFLENLWFPSVEIQTDLKIKRSVILKICGNISKHNISRLTVVSKMLKTLFKDNGHDLGLRDSLNVIEEFQQQVEDYFLNYRITKITSLLSEILWGIYDYLYPVYVSSLHEGESESWSYRYEYPEELETSFSRECFWELMNDIRTKPYVRRISVPSYLDMRL
jgi:hypothetical protein